jgi:hypothetical protein
MTSRLRSVYLADVVLAYVAERLIGKIQNFIHGKILEAASRKLKMRSVSTQHLTAFCL